MGGRRKYADTYEVMVSCGHRGYVHSDESPQPGDKAYCCHERFGPAEEVHVIEVGVTIHDLKPPTILLAKPVYTGIDGP